MADGRGNSGLFALPPGVDFASALIDGLLNRFGALPPEEFARIRLIVNTERMRRRITEILSSGPARLHPRIETLSSLLGGVEALRFPPAVSPLRRRLEISQFVDRLLEAEPDLAPRAALFDLSESLARLFAEMHGEGVTPEAIRSLDVSDQSGHWARSLRFLEIVSPFFESAGEAPDPESLQRALFSSLAETWKQSEPSDPIILAGSTGSRGATLILMEAVARLAKGAVVLPGFDFDLPEAVWLGMGDALYSEDHPQYRFKVVMDRLGLGKADVATWIGAAAPSPERNRIISLALRPAPVTDQWRIEGPRLGDLRLAMGEVTLVEAPNPRAEAETIALRMRVAIDEGKTAALITPDRMLTRQVAAALDRWNIAPDDSAGQPLHLSPPGRFLRHVAGLLEAELGSEALLVLLKHPLTASGEDRGSHLVWTRELELYLRRKAIPSPSPADLAAWAERGGGPREGREAWANWVGSTFCGQHQTEKAPLADQLSRHLGLAEAIAAGPGKQPSADLWDKATGRKAKEIVSDLAANADAAGPITAGDYAILLASLLRGAEVRDRDTGHPNALILGTLEARVQSADLVILGGMNEGVWPEAPAPDPWLNRRMRAEAGLLLPERRIGLAAHDFQQAVAAPEVWISRAIRSDEAETVASRWINRLTNLLSGPYAIYAERILRLRALDPLTPSADAPLRGTIVHEILHRFVFGGPAPEAGGAREALLDVAREVLEANCPWPTVRRMWLARFEKGVDWLLETEIERRRDGSPLIGETQGHVDIASPPLKLKAKPDRIDRTEAGDLLIYDYKTGKVSTEAQQIAFDKQLLLQAAMAEQGAFAAAGRAKVAGAAFIALGTQKIVPAPMEDCPIDETWAFFLKLMRHWADVRHGFSARQAMVSTKDRSYYDHLARFGEWNTSDPAVPEDLV
ncbi:MAG: double-strand break repair protein AddB [Rhodobacteraceae bacterium]|nr:double-strand break repair protein AddB [Paracoccaceae bacterium]